MFVVGNMMRNWVIPKAGSHPAPSGKIFPRISNAPSAMWRRISSLKPDGL